MHNLLEKRTEKWTHMQSVSHRLCFDHGNRLPESGHSTMRASFAEGMRLGEVDGVYTKDGVAIAEHDFHAIRNLGIDEAISSLDSTKVVGLPILINRITRDASNAVNFSKSRSISGDTVTKLFTLIEDFLKLEPEGTIFPDLRNEQVAQFFAELSFKDDYTRNHVAVMFYTFTIYHGTQFVTEVEKFHPHPDWKARCFGGVLNFYPSELPTVAKRLDMSANNAEDMLKVGQHVLNSYQKAGITLFALVAMGSGLTPKDYPDFSELSKEAQEALYAEEAMVNLVNWVRGNDAFPNLKIGSGTRAYDFSIPVDQHSDQREFYTYDLMTCAPTPWPKDRVLRRIKALYATPGKCEKVYNPNFIIADEPQWAAFGCCNIEADTSRSFRHPRFDMVPSTQD